MANRMTSASTVTPGQAMATIPTMMASTPRAISGVDSDFMACLSEQRRMSISMLGRKGRSGKGDAGCSDIGRPYGAAVELTDRAGERQPGLDVGGDGVGGRIAVHLDQDAAVAVVRDQRAGRLGEHVQPVLDDRRGVIRAGPG